MPNIRQVSLCEACTVSKGVSREARSRAELRGTQPPCSRRRRPLLLLACGAPLALPELAWLFAWLTLLAGAAGVAGLLGAAREALR